MFFRIFLALWTSSHLAACAINRSPSSSLLEKRADYDGESQAAEALSSAETSKLLIPRRTATKTTDVWIHPHELPSKDYFLGGWVRTIIIGPRWELSINQQEGAL